MTRSRGLVSPAGAAIPGGVAALLAWRAVLSLGAVDACAAPHRVEIAPYLVDLDSAPAAELALLPGVGPSLAAEIVADRARRGAFASIEALARVRGVGDRTVGGLRAFATASASPRDGGDR